jgi:branched-subunit amino acid aminotransferase/4-amino-4-deoxychorismate lyase
MSAVWIDGRLYDRDELGQRDQALVAARLAPTARLVLRPTWMTGEAEVNGPEWIRKVAERLTLAPDLSQAVPDEGMLHDRRLLALVGPRLEDVVHGPEAARIASVTLWPVSTMESPTYAKSVRLLTSPWPINQQSPVASLLLVSDGEYAAGRRAALEAGRDEALVCNLAGEVARVGRSAVFLQSGSGHIATPPLESGAPDSPWRSLALRALGAVERSITPEDLHEASGVVAVSEDGHATEVRQLDDREFPEADEFVRSVGAALG